jgi:putative multiple sugar transport system substrate-binding protein
MKAITKWSQQVNTGFRFFLLPLFESLFFYSNFKGGNMKNISKAVIIVLALCLTVSAFATGTPEAGSKLIGVAMPTKSLQRWNQDGAYLKEKLEAQGFTVDLQYANDDVSTQVSQLENMITKGCKVLVIASIDGTALKGVLKQAGDAGVKVIAYDRLIKDTPNCDYYATFDNYKVGKIQGDFIVDKLKLATGAGPFNMEVFGGSPDDNNAYLFNKGAMDALQPYIKSGKLVIVSGQTDMSLIAIPGWKPEGSQARMDNLLTAYYADKKLDVVLSPNDSLAQGIVASLKSAGYGTADKPFPVLTGQDCDKINVKMMIAGEQSMSVFKDTRTLAQRVVTMVGDIMAGKKPEVNDTKSYDNGVKVVPSYLCEPVFADKNNYKKILLDSGYYMASDLK